MLISSIGTGNDLFHESSSWQSMHLIVLDSLQRVK